jgi:chemotaxis protein methyltransferase WspC
VYRDRRSEPVQTGAPRLQPRFATATKPRAATPPTAPRDKPDIDSIRRSADQGHLAEAAQWCEQHLADGNPSPEVLHLLGLIRDSSGNLAEAAEYYRKALYLDPNHHETIVHLALLLKTTGDTVNAGLLSDRARRLEQRNKKRHA